MTRETMVELNLPAADHAIAEVERRLGRPLPPALATLYRRHDGLQSYGIIGDGLTTLQTNLFACDRDNVRTAWLFSDDRDDLQRMLERDGPPLCIEHRDFYEEFEEHLAGSYDEVLAPLKHDWLCFATDWDGTAGDFYCLDTRAPSSIVTCVPKPRLMSQEAVAAACTNPETTTIGTLLDRWNAPAWLITPDLYDERTVVMFHSRSRDAPPGQGAGEQGGGPEYAQLTALPDWRRLLSNFAPSPLSLDGRRWATVEHYFQAQKFRDIAPEYYETFTLDSDSALGHGDGGAARKAGGKRGHPLSPQQRIEWEARRREAMLRALRAKYTQNEEHRAVLLATRSAKLTHKPARARYCQVEYALMVVRAELGG